MEADMKAARMHEYGKALVLDDVPVPDIQPDEILVKITAVGISGGRPRRRRGRVGRRHLPSLPDRQYTYLP